MPAIRKNKKFSLHRGGVLIELTITIPLIVIILLLIVDTSLAIFEYNTLVKQTRNAARYLTAIAPSPTTIWTPYSPQVGSLLMCGKISSSCGDADPYILNGFDASQIYVNYGQDGLGISSNPDGTNGVYMKLIQIQVVGYQYKFLFPEAFRRYLGIEIPGGYVTFPDITVTMRQSN